MTPSQGLLWPLFTDLCGGKHDINVMPQSKCKFYLGSALTDFLSLSSTMNSNMTLIVIQWLTFNLQSLESIDHLHQVTEVPLLQASKLW